MKIEMRSVLPVALLLALCTCAYACGSTEEGPPAAYLLSSRPLLPFPTDAMMVPDASQPNGVRIQLEPMGKNLGDVDEAIYLFGEDFAHALDTIDGWSTLGPVFAPTTEDVDPASLEGHVLLIDLATRKVVETEERAFGGKTMFSQQMHWVSARPPAPLAPKTKHAIVLLRGLKSTSGEAFARAPAFAALFDGESSVEGDPARIESARTRLAGVADVLSTLGISPKDVLSADTFTTQSIDEETNVLLQAYRSVPDPTISTPAVFSPPAMDPRWDGPANADYSNIRATARVTVEVPNYRLDVKGRMVIDASHVELQSHETVEALILLPTGTPPFRIAVYQHGVGDKKESVWRFANELCATGVAVVAFDAPLHGYRTDKPKNAATEFINIIDPGLVVDNFRQAETETAFLVRAIDQMATVDFLGDGGAELDASHLLWIGNSLGSIIGGAVVGLEPRYEGAALMVGGGTLLEFFDRVLGGFDLHQFPAELFVSVAQAALDRGDPSNYAHLSSEKQILLMQAMQDEVMPPGATRAMARAMGLPQIDPVYERDQTVPEISAPTMRRGWTQFSPAMHSLAYSPDDAPEAYARSRAQLFHFVETWAHSGIGEIR